MSNARPSMAEVICTEEKQRRADQLLRYVLAEGEPSEGVGWLIEKGQMALGVDQDNKPCWVAYTHIGVIRFARERDAMAVLWGLRSYDDGGFHGCYVSEHCWGFPSGARPLSIETEIRLLINEVAPPPLVVSETAIRQLQPLLVELIERRKRDGHAQ